MCDQAETSCRLQSIRPTNSLSRRFVPVVLENGVRSRPAGFPVSSVAERSFVRRTTAAKSHVFMLGNVVNGAFLVGQGDIAGYN